MEASILRGSVLAEGQHNSHRNQRPSISNRILFVQLIHTHSLCIIHIFIGVSRRNHLHLYMLGRNHMYFWDWRLVLYWFRLSIHKHNEHRERGQAVSSSCSAACVRSFMVKPTTHLLVDQPNGSIWIYRLGANLESWWSGLLGHGWSLSLIGTELRST